MPFYIGIHRYPITVLHSHPFAEFVYVIDGSGYEAINGKTHRMGSRTASFLLPHHLHEIHSDPGQAIRKYCCMFDINILFESEDDSDWWKLLYQVSQFSEADQSIHPDTNHLFWSVLQYVHVHFAEELTLDILTRTFHMLLNARVMYGLLSQLGQIPKSKSFDEFR